MSLPNIQRLIGAATPLWAGEAEVVRSYWTSPKRSLQTDLLWLRRQCFKEFWGSGVGEYDRGGVVPGQLRNLSDKVLEVDESWPEEDALTALRLEHQAEHGALGMRACKLTEGELNPKPKLDLAALEKFRASLPRSPLSSAVMVSKMRDEADGW